MKRQFGNWLCGVAVGFLSLTAITGCNPKVEKPAEEKSAEASADPHAGHDHSAPGPHGGHVTVLEPMDAHVEWGHDDAENILMVYVDDITEEGGTIDFVKVDLKVTGNDPKTYELKQEGTEGEAASHYMIEAPELLSAIEVGEGVEAKLIVSVNGEEQSVMLGHDHDDHGHAH